MTTENAQHKGDRSEITSTLSEDPSPGAPPNSLALVPRVLRPEANLGPQIAVRWDSVLLLSMEDLDGLDLRGRKVWTGIELTPAEAEDVRRRVINAAAEGAAHIGGKLRKKKSGDS